EASVSLWRLFSFILRQALKANLALVEEESAKRVMLADTGYWSEENCKSETEDCELLIATRKDWKQRQAMRDQTAPRGRIPGNLTIRERMDRKLLTKRGKALYRKRGQTVEPVFGQMKGTQGADEFSMRGLGLCDGEWKFQSAVHNLRKLHSRCVKMGKN
ncbi:MAG: transposase, partial [Magnetococcales bacterium]|nr:transposase [Magnetococcales bacterium]